MKPFTVFMKKEALELWRTYKAVIICAVFLSLALISPLFAKMTPEIMRLSGLDITLPEPTAIDSYTQFFGNIAQMGLLVILIVFGAALVREKRRGTAGLLTARGLPRWVIALGKHTSSLIMWSVAYWLSAGVCYGFTAYYFPGDTVQNTALALTGVWFYGVMLLSIALLLSAVFKSSGGPVAIPIALLFLLPLFDLWKPWADISPAWLLSNSIGLMTETSQISPRHALVPFVLTGAVCLLCTLGAVIRFNRNEL